MSNESPSPLSEKYIYGVVDGLKTAGINKPATPDDTIFATPSYIYSTLSSNGKDNFITELSNSFIANPDKLLFYCNSPRQSDKHLDEVDQSLKQKLVPRLSRTAREQETFFLSEKQLITVFKALHTPSQEEGEPSPTELQVAADAIFSGFIEGTVHSSLKNLTPDNLIAKGRIPLDNLQYTQDRITYLIYALTSAVMETHDIPLLTKLYELLAFQTPYLDREKPLSGLFISASQSFDDQTFAKYTLINHTRALLQDMLQIETEEMLTDRMTDALRSSPSGIQYLQEAQENIPRKNLLLKFYKKRNHSLGQIPNITTDSIGEYYTQPLPFPENILCTPQKLWYLYLEYFSIYCLEKGLVNSPILPLPLPDGTVRFIALQEGNNRLAAREVMKYVAETGMPSDIVDPRVVDSFLAYSRPNLLDTTFNGLEQNNMEKQIALLSQACHGLPKVGIHIATNKNKHPEIAAKMLSFDQSATFVNVIIGNKTLKLQLNDKYELCYTDGKPLEVDGQTKIWWEHVILPPLADLICKSPEEHEGYVDGTEGMSQDERSAVAKHAILKRIGHLRSLGLKPNGEEKHHTPKQRDKVYELENPLPHISRLDLDELNTMAPHNEHGKKKTYIPPVEKELMKPLTICLPHAYDESDALLKEDPNR